MLSGGDQFGSLVGIRYEVVQPAMGVTQGLGEDRTASELASGGSESAAHLRLG